MCVEVISNDIVAVPEISSIESSSSEPEDAQDDSQNQRAVTPVHSRNSSVTTAPAIENSFLSFGQSALTASFQVLQARICSFKGWKYLGVPPPPIPKSAIPEQWTAPDKQLTCQSRPKRVVRFVGSSSLNKEAQILRISPVANDSSDEDSDCDSRADISTNSDSNSTTTADAPCIHSQPDLLRLLLTYEPDEDADGSEHEPSPNPRSSPSPPRPSSAPCVDSECHFSISPKPGAISHHSRRAPAPLLQGGGSLELPPWDSADSPALNGLHAESRSRATSPDSHFPAPPLSCCTSALPCSSPPAVSPSAHASGGGAAAAAAGTSPPIRALTPTTPPWLPETIKCGVCCEQGARASNEDMAFALEIFEPPQPASTCGEESFPSSFSSPQAFSTAACFGVFDGHGGIEAAEHMSKNLPGLIASRCCQIKSQGPEEVTSILLSLEDQLKERFRLEWEHDEKERDPGTTALVATIIDDMLLIANVGDSRLILVAEQKDSHGQRMAYVTRATKDHNFGNEDERRRACAAGAHGELYADSLLEVSRSIGDFRTKSELGAGVIIPDPEVTTLQLTPDSLFCVAFSDGISSKMDDCAVCNKVATSLNSEAHLNDPEHAAAELCSYAINSLSSEDNCSAVVVLFRDRPPPKPVGRRHFFSRK